MNRRAGVAAFDFDGTLVPGDSLRPFLTQLLGRRRFAAVLGRAGAPMLVGYGRDGRDGAKKALLVRAVAGLPATAVAAAGEAFGAGLASRVRPEMTSRLDWHRAREHRLVLVSASLADYLEPFGRLVGFDDVIATRLEVATDGRLTGQLAGNNVRAEEKATRLAGLLGSGPVELWAYGDSAGDRELLAMADHPTFVGRRRRAPHGNGNRPD
ncbi:MAG: HAD-IB family hydrolase [Acidimicrobiaceae bacterium]|nr:HAD-IB family hydrolase [Acidimicrobiaceae bacterium]